MEQNVRESRWNSTFCLLLLDKGNRRYSSFASGSLPLRLPLQHQPSLDADVEHYKRCGKRMLELTGPSTTYRCCA